MHSFKHSLATAAVLLTSASAFADGNAINQSVDLGVNAPNRYMQCLTDEARSGQHYGQARRACQNLLTDALAEVPDVHRGTFEQTARAMFENGELIRNDQRLRGEEQRAESRIARAEVQREAFQRDMHVGTVADDSGVGKALDLYTDCVSQHREYLRNLERAESACATERTYVETLVGAGHSDEVFETVDRVVLHKWRRASAKNGGGQ